MKRTLIVNYTPRENSNTKKMVDYFIERNKDKTDITILDLVEETPDLLLKENLNLVVARNFGGVKLNEEQQKLLDKNDQLTNQLLETDYVVLVTPVYNYSLPATVKAWFDAVIQAGRTFTSGEKGLVGLCENTQALMLTTSGSDFAIEPLKSVNFATPLASACFGLLGIPTETITVFGTQQYADKVEQLLEDSKDEIDVLSEKWY